MGVIDGFVAVRFRLYHFRHYGFYFLGNKPDLVPFREIFFREFIVAEGVIYAF